MKFYKEFVYLVYIRRNGHLLTFVNRNVFDQDVDGVLQQNYPKVDVDGIP